MLTPEGEDEDEDEDGSLRGKREACRTLNQRHS